ncbi:hypothetical protein [Spirosoma foliorum]|uniref:Outer membrane protein beta-barrel domain-containing protein n=1 Tax=Spirosoma foliorum TaxID=2710596 RepID=A0A7G5GTD1_9BACT|nr:hypothetical protein [Spirosoma foliorum]QMW02123.1 hypothetical protein H3H32_30000 [Spirosoma foliorum]
MDELDKNRPDDFWRKAFDEAAETPPLRVWDSIERRLDESNDTKILPLWGLGLISSRPAAWGMGVAAAVTLLLIGWWAGSAQVGSNQPTTIAQHSESSERVTKKTLTPKSTNADESLAQSSPEVTSATKSGFSSARVGSDASLTALPIGEQTSRVLAQIKANTDTKDQAISSQRMAVGASLVMGTKSSSIPPGIENGSLSSGTGGSMSVNSFAARTVTTTIEPSNSSELARFEPLSGKSLRFRDIGQIHRIVWHRPTEMALTPETFKSKQKNHDVWASATVMPGSFNPMVAVQTTSIANANYANLNASKNTTTGSSISSRANFSVAYQAGAGVQLSERWSLESGIGYLSGRSTVETPAQASAASLVALTGRNTTSGNLYVDALKSSFQGNDLAAASPVFTNSAGNAYQQANYAGSTQQILTNNYQYMQVPLQVGYQLRPRKRLSLAVLGGLITNIFVRNTVGNEIVVTAKDGVYRPLSLAATMGARLRYRPTQQWSASLAGVYQPSLGLGTQPEAQVQTHPTSAGMSFGVDYHF